MLQYETNVAAGSVFGSLYEEEKRGKVSVILSVLTTLSWHIFLKNSFGPWRHLISDHVMPFPGQNL